MGDLFMSLIHTCELNGANPFHYLTELQQHAEELAANPAEWMPWNYRAFQRTNPDTFGAKVQKPARMLRASLHMLVFGGSAMGRRNA